MKLKFCVACGAKRELHHHHIIPKVLAKPDDPELLITLCNDCHRIIHGLSPSKVNLSNLVKEGMARRKAQGYRIHMLQYGFKIGKNGKVVPDKEQRTIMKLIDTLRSDNLTYKEIAKILNSSGYRYRNGAKFKERTVNTINQIILDGKKRT